MEKNNLEKILLCEKRKLWLVQQSGLNLILTNMIGLNELKATQFSTPTFSLFQSTNEMK